MFVVWDAKLVHILFDTTATVDRDNRVESLSSLSDADSPIQANIGSPAAASSHIVQQSKEANPLRILIMNCESIQNNKAEPHAVINSIKPDIILGNESWLSPDSTSDLRNFSRALWCNPERQSRWRTWWRLYCFQAGPALYGNSGIGHRLRDRMV